MVRFIFICMGVVALSLVTMATQSIRDGISGQEQAIAARNVEQPVVAEASPDDLNNIESAAGGTDPVVTYDPADTFKGGFSDTAPKALAETPEPVLVETPEQVPLN